MWVSDEIIIESQTVLSVRLDIAISVMKDSSQMILMAAKLVEIWSPSAWHVCWMGKMSNASNASLRMLPRKMFAVISYTLSQTETEGALAALEDAWTVLMTGQTEILCARNAINPKDT